MKTFRLLVCLLMGVAMHAAQAANPIAYGMGLCDPAPVVFGDRVYIYGTHDPDTKDWVVWSSANLVDWKQEGSMEPKDTFLAADLAAGKKIPGCWATCGASRNGKYYWYYCSGDQIGVSVSSAPGGPWSDPLGKPLIAHGDYPTGARDPDIFKDEDGKTYMVFGVHKYCIVRLNEDMISLAEPGRMVEVINAYGPGGEMKVDDKPALHKHKGRYYLSWSSYYAVSDHVYGPYLYKGSVVDGDHTAPIFQIECKEDRVNLRKWDKLRLDRHGGFFQFHGQWYYACNDGTLGDANRGTLLSYAHYRDNGDLAPVRLDPTGVGEYDALNLRTEAEDYFGMNGAEVKEGVSGGFVVQNITAASRLHYPRMKNLCAKTSMEFYVASASGGEIEVREGTPDGKVLGVCKVLPSGGLDHYDLSSCKLQNAPGTADLWLTFKGGSGELMRLDWFGFPDSLACKVGAVSQPVRGVPGKYVNISVKASSESGEHKAANTLDGDVRSFWCPAEKQPLPQSLTFDLGSVEKLREVRFMQRCHGAWILTKNFGINYISRAALYFSEDGQQYEKISEEDWPNSPMMYSFVFAPRPARYIRLEILEAYHPNQGRSREPITKSREEGKVSIAEIEVLTAEPVR